MLPAKRRLAQNVRRPQSVALHAHVECVRRTEQAEALDVLYMLRGDPTALASLASLDAAHSLASILDRCEPAASTAPTGAAPPQTYGALPGSLAAESSSAGDQSGADLPLARDLAASLGLFPAPDAAGVHLPRSVVAGKALRVLLYMVRGEGSWRAVAAERSLFAPLARIAALAAPGYAALAVDAEAAAPLPQLLPVRDVMESNKAASGDAFSLSIVTDTSRTDSSCGSGDEHQYSADKRCSAGDGLQSSSNMDALLGSAIAEHKAEMAAAMRAAVPSEADAFAMMAERLERELAHLLKGFAGLSEQVRQLHVCCHLCT